MSFFGPFRVVIDNKPLPRLRSRKAQWLVALLTLRHGRPVEREWLAGMLWPDVDQSQAFANLRPVLSELRKAFGSQAWRILSPNSQTLILELEGAEVDVLAFDAAMDRKDLSALQQAVSLYHGPLLEGCPEEWVDQERRIREQQCLAALKNLADTATIDGDHAAAVQYLQRAVAIDPLWDTAIRGLMEAHSKSGDRNAAQQVYREFVERLRSDPKATPDDETSALYARLRAEARSQASPRAATVELAAPVPSISGYLPHPLTDLVGREDERIEVALFLRRCRLVTLTGVGGIGKTRLAREVAGEVVGEYAHGVWLVALEAVSEGRLVIQQIASVLGLREEQGRTPLQSVTDHIRQKRLLLVLDNCEHLLEASAQVASDLLRECAGVRILATSREALGITGETVWNVPVSAVPDTESLPQGQATLLRVLMGYDSVQLFVERAQAVQKGFVLSGSNARMAAQACRQLEGIPLAIELAAARARVMTVERIASHLNDYLGLLTAGSRTAQSRQQTLRATLDWSYDLLTEPERSLLKRLSVFSGGCSLEVAEFVCGSVEVWKYGSHDVHTPTHPNIQTSKPPNPHTPTPPHVHTSILDLLTSLVDKSLVLFEERERAGGRYRLLEMVRQYAAEGLQASGDSDQIKTRHRDWFLALAEEAEPQLNGAEQENWLQRLETEHDNLRAALAWGEMLAQGAEAGLRLAGALSRFWNIRGEYNEGRSYLGKALERAVTPVAAAARAKALNGAGALAFRQADYASVQALCEESLRLQKELGDRRGMGESLNSLGNVAYVQRNYASAQGLYEESLGLHKELGDRRGVAGALINLGLIAQYQNEPAVARTRFEESLSIFKQLGIKREVARSLYYMGRMALGESDYAVARAQFEECLGLFNELGDRPGTAWSLYSLGDVTKDQGDPASARTLYDESLRLFRELGDRLGLAGVINGLGNAFFDLGDYASARTLYEEGKSIFRELGDTKGVAWSLNILGNAAKEQGDPNSARTLYEEGMSLSRDVGDTLGIAWSLNYLGNLAKDMDDPDSARTQFEESLRLFRDLSHKLGIVESLHGLASVMLEPAELQRSARLRGASHELRENIGAQMPINERKKYQDQLEQARSALGRDAFASAWEEGRFLTWEQAVASALEGPGHVGSAP